MITYRSGGNTTQIDYILEKRQQKKKVRKAKAISFEEVSK